MIPEKEMAGIIKEDGTVLEAAADSTRLAGPWLPLQTVYEVGTLHYDRAQLIRVFAWLLGGDFAFAFFEQVFVRYIPIYAKELHGANLLIGLISGSFAGLINFLFLPHISLYSDRLRSRLGRRVPLLLWATPTTVASLLLVGFAPEIGRAMHAWMPGKVSVSATTLTLGLLCGFVVSYHFFNMVLVNAYNWLIRDIVPSSVIGRFLSAFRIVTTLASFAFLRWVFPVIGEHRHEVFVSVGVIYAAVFTLMCWQVEEGQYAAPGAVEKGVFTALRRYVRECLSIPLYRNYFIFQFLMVAAVSSSNPFFTLYAKESLHLGMDDVGKIFAWGTLVSAAVFFPMGWLCDRFRPFFVLIGAVGLFSLIGALGYFLVHDRASWWIYSVAVAAPTGTYLLGNSTLSMTVFPAVKFGQFAAGLNVFGFGGIILGNYLLGSLMDAVHSHYQWVFLWSAVASALALIPLWQVYRGWQRHGGPDHYVAPLPSVE